MTETKLYSLIKETMIEVCAQHNIPEEQIDYQRVESPSNPGIPDINYCIDGNEFWIECKMTDGVGARNQLKPMQKAWHKRRSMAGGIVFVLRHNFSDGHTVLICREQLIAQGTLSQVLNCIVHFVGIVK